MRRPASLGGRGRTTTLVLAVGALVMGVGAGYAVAANLVVPAQVRLPAASGAVSLYGLDVDGNEDVERNSRTTITLSRKTGGPQAHLRYYPPRDQGDVDVDVAAQERLRANMGAEPGAWFHTACDPQDVLKAVPGSDGAGSQPAVPPAPRLDHRPMEETDLGFEVAYVKDCPGGEVLDRHGRLLMMPAPGNADGASIMIDVDLHGIGQPGPPPESLRAYLQDVAERVRKLE